jgi:hypothetical protein
MVDGNGAPDHIQVTDEAGAGSSMVEFADALKIPVLEVMPGTELQDA